MLKNFFKARHESDTTQEEGKLENTTNELDTAKLQEELSSALSQAQEATKAKTALENTVAELEGKLETLQAALSELEQVKADMQAQAAKAKADARMAKIVAAVGEDKAESIVLRQRETLEEAQFESILGAMVSTLDKESTTELFKEKGASGVVDVNKAPSFEESPEAKILKQKYTKE